MATSREQVTTRFHIELFLLNICSGTICKCSREQVQILSNSEEKTNCEYVKMNDYDLQSKNNFCWFIVILKQSVRIKIYL